jgi:hypothetical protein
VLLSAQATDVGVNKATRRLFPVAGTPQAMLDLGLERLEGYIKTIGLYPTKARNLLATCRILVEQHGVVPRTRGPWRPAGVGRKTANVVLNVAFGRPTMAVDTHIFRVGNRTGMAPGKTAWRWENNRYCGACRGVPGGRAPLADPAGPLSLPGAALALLGMRGGAVLLPAQNAGALNTFWRAAPPEAARISASHALGRWPPVACTSLR